MPTQKKIKNILNHISSLKSCFAGHTMITMVDKTYKRIDNIEIGDKIKSYDLETEKLQNSVVEEIYTPIYKNIVEYTFADNTIIQCTDDHPIYPLWTKGKGWTSKLELDDMVFMPIENKFTELLSCKSIKTDEVKTYSLGKLNNNYNYFANRILVHNYNLSHQK
jgi:hypothetical protein